MVTRLSEMVLFSDKPHYTLLHAAAHVGIGGACLLAVLLTLYAPITLVHSHIHTCVLLHLLSAISHAGEMTCAYLCRVSCVVCVRFLTERRFLQDMRSVWRTKKPKAL
jgi:flagellar biosynthesis protein FliQ